MRLKARNGESFTGEEREKSERFSLLTEAELILMWVENVPYAFIRDLSSIWFVHCKQADIDEYKRINFLSDTPNLSF